MHRALSVGLIAALVIAPAVFVPARSAIAEWQPPGPVTFNIGFRVGGGADIQARLIGEEITRKFGWKFIYKNDAGRGGSNLARTIKGAAKNGLTVGIAVTSTFSYTPLVSKQPTYAASDFHYIIATAPTQLGLAVRQDSGWRTLDDVIAAARSRPLRFAVMSPRLGDAANLIAKKHGVKFNSVKAKGGRGVLNGLIARELDLGFIAGIHAKAVSTGELINLASAETTRLGMSPHAPTLQELGFPYAFGDTFVVFAPNGADAIVTAALANAIKAVLSDHKSKAYKFVKRTFGNPSLKTGPALANQIADEIANNRNIIASIKP